MKITRVIICAVLLVIFLSFQAQDAKAYSFDYNIGDRSSNVADPSNLADFLSDNGVIYSAYSDGFSGAYSATFIGYRAMNTNTFTASNANGAGFFITDEDAAGSLHSTAGDSLAIDSATAFFSDTTDTHPTGINLGDTQYLSYYILNDSWSYTGNSGKTLNFLKDDIIVGFGDASGDNDKLDLVIALRANPVPIPGALWLLGSGLLGLVGIRRRHSKA